MRRREAIALALLTTTACGNDMRVSSFAFGSGGSGAVGGAPPVDEDPTIISSSVAVHALGQTSGLQTPQLRVQVEAAAITLGGTMRSAGTSPPVVTLTGTLLFAAGAHPGIKVEIDSVAGGTARGQATFRVSYDSGSTWAHSGVTTAATYALDGAASGVTLNFPTGTYGTDQNWEGTVATIRSTEGNAYTFTQATANSQPVLRKAAVTPDAKDAMFFAGATRFVASTDAAVVALFTNDPALTVMGRLAYTVADADGDWLSACDSAQPTNRKRRFRQSSTAAGGLRCNHACTNDAGTAAANNTSSADHPSVTTAAHNECWFFPGSNGGANLSINDSAVTLGNSSCNPGTNTPTRVAIGCEADSTPAGAFAGYFYDLAVWNSVLSSGSRTAWNTEMTA